MGVTVLIGFVIRNGIVLFMDTTRQRFTLSCVRQSSQVLDRISTATNSTRVSPAAVPP